MIPIYLKTVYSFLTSIITIDDLINWAIEHEYQHLCICDNNMYGVMEFITKCQKHHINPIVGLDIKYCLLYAKNYEGYQNLLYLSSKISKDGFSLDLLKGKTSSLIAFIPSSSAIQDDLILLFEDYYVYGNDDLHQVLCLNKEDTSVIQYLHLLRDGKKISDDVLFDDNIYYQGNDNSLYQEIFNRCHLSLPVYALDLPDYCQYNDTKGLNSDLYLYNLSILGLKKRLNNQITGEYQSRLLYELDVIKKMGFSNYFLIVYDYIKYAKTHDILTGPGRGSACGSLVSYSLGITDVDPLKYHLLFERFLNLERITMPDIDTDFPDTRRDEVIRYVKEKYGEDKVSLITTFVPFGSKMALRDMGRVLNIPSYAVDSLCKKLADKNLEEGLLIDDVKKFLSTDNKLKNLYHVALRIEKIPRHSSVHAAGVVMANHTLYSTIPLVYNETFYLSAYEAMYLENLGLLKMDFLGIRNLSIIDNILKMIAKYEKITLKFSDISLNDDLTNQLFASGDTLGIFQFESMGMRDFLIKLQPNSFMDIYNANAFYRPGPSMFIDKYIKRRQKKEAIDYLDKRLEPILKDTCGIMVYQEQIMQVASVMGGFSLGEADILRRMISKKKKDEMLKYQDKFILGAIKNGYREQVAQEVFNQILNFASYGFNKSHSVAYSMISYRMAYLKAHYKVYFYVALLSSIGDDTKKILYIKEMKKKNIQVCKPDIHKSMLDVSLYYQKVILPFSYIKGIGMEVSERIMKARDNGFSDIYQFMESMIKEKISRNILELLIRAGSLDSFGYNRYTLIQNLDSLINYANLCLELGHDFVLKPEISLYDEYDRNTLINNEKELFGFYLTNHPVSFYKSKVNSINLCDIKKYFNQVVKVVVMVDKIKEIITKKGEKMAFIQGSDEEDSISITVFPNLYQSISKLEKSDIIMVEGRVERRSEFSIIASSIENIKESK